ncbi:MAG: hypothetical protein WBN66_06300 [Smithella sp.]
MTQTKSNVKSTTGRVKTQHRASLKELSNILSIIREAESNQTSEIWEYCTDEEDLKQIALVISKYGSIESEL